MIPITVSDPHIAGSRSRAGGAIPLTACSRALEAAIRVEEPAGVIALSTGPPTSVSSGSRLNAA